MKVEYYVTDATTGIPVWAEIRKATQFDYKKTVEEQWQTSWLSDFIQTDSLENSIQQIRSIPAFDRWRSGKRVIFAIFEGGVIMLQEKYAKLDDLAAPNCYVAPPTSEDLSYVVHFRQICKRYNIDFSSADSDEKNFVMKMAEKSFMPKRA